MHDNLPMFTGVKVTKIFSMLDDLCKIIDIKDEINALVVSTCIARLTIILGFLDRYSSRQSTKMMYAHNRFAKTR